MQKKHLAVEVWFACFFFFNLELQQHTSREVLLSDLLGVHSSVLHCIDYMTLSPFVKSNFKL